MKKLFTLIKVLLLVVVVWLVVKTFLGMPNLTEFFKPKKPVVDQTPVVIQQIRPLAQLVTITAYTEVTADTTAPASTGEKLRDILNPFSLKINMDRKLVVVGKTIVHAGVNLEKLSNQNIYISGDSIRVQLPPAEILDVILNPSGTEIFLEQGKWEPAAVVNMKITLQQKAVEEVKNRGVLFQADERASEVLTNFLMAAGYKKVNIIRGRLG